MYLYINPLLPDIQITLLEKNIPKKTIQIPKGNDFDSFPETIIEILENENIEEIWALLWPGAFTRMRIITLTLGSLHLTKKINIKGTHFFDLISKDIPIIQANTEEYRIKINNEDILTKKQDLSLGKYRGYGIKNDFTEGKVFIEYSEDWDEIYTFFTKLSTKTELTPIYIKSPHITTWLKKKMSPS